LLQRGTHKEPERLKVINYECLQCVTTEAERI
jgi:hypothetical protein